MANSWWNVEQEILVQLPRLQEMEKERLVFFFYLKRYCPVSTGELSRENKKNYTCLILPTTKLPYFLLCAQLNPGSPLIFFKKHLFIWLCLVLVLSGGIFHYGMQTLQLWHTGLDAPQHMGSQFMGQGSNLHPLHYKENS